MAGADPRAAMTRPSGYEGTADSAAYLEATLARVESWMRLMKEDLEGLDEYYRRLRERLEELQPAGDADDTDGDTGEDAPTEDDGE